MSFRSVARVVSGLFLFALLALPASAQVSDVYVIPAAANTPGALGTYWATSFFIMNPQGHALTVTLAFVPAGGAVGDAFAFDIGPNETLYAFDILGEDGFELSNVAGSLLVFVDPADNPGLSDPINRAVVVQTRTYNVLSSGATVGQGIPGAMTGLLDFQLDGISAIATGVLSEGINGAFRTNVGAVNLSNSSATLHVTVWDVEGDSLGTFPLQLPPRGFIQDALPVTSNEPLTVEFIADYPSSFPADGDDLVIPYASVVDNRTGDPTYLEAVLLAAPGTLFKTGTVARTPAKISAEAAKAVIDASRHRGVRVLPRKER